MTSRAVALFRQRIERRASALAPDLRKAILAAYDRLAAAMPPGQLETFIRSGQVERIFSELLTPEAIDTAFAPVARVLRDGVEQAGARVAAELPGIARGAMFDVLSPDVIRGIRALNDRALNTLAGGIQETVRAYVENGIRDGVGPRTIARDLRAIIGLAPNQAEAVTNFRAALEAGDIGALTRQLRDRRFDAQVRKAFAGDGLTPAQIDRMTESYRSRFVAFNAETNARTLALDAQKSGQQLTWEDAVARGDIDGDALMKRWSGVLDDRERDEHLRMEGETVPWDEYYSNGEMVPGESVFNCRCLSIMSTSGVAPRVGAGASGVTTDQLRGAGSRR